MVEIERYFPKRGDLVWLDFEPQTGKEQTGRRPAVVISNTKYNKIVGLAMFCPITTKKKGYPFILWFFIGFFTRIYGLIAIVGLPIKKDE